MRHVIKQRNNTSHSVEVTASDILHYVSEKLGIILPPNTTVETDIGMVMDDDEPLLVTWEETNHSEKVENGEDGS